MAASDSDTSDKAQESPSSLAEQETSYLYVRSLGAGAFGEANLYRKTEDNSLVVWKEINLARLGEKEQRDAMNEIEILSLLNHANIITYFNHFLDGEILLIELEYANGGNLAQKLQNQTELMDESVVKWYLFQLASALDHIHHYGIIHRDVKTLNVFVTKSDLLKLGDFGISKILQSKSEMAETFVGTLLYMSPELVKGDKYDYKTDIWSLGCVVFEILTLTRTFQASNPLRLANVIVSVEQEEIDGRYSQQMKAIVKHMLQKDPRERPSAMEILDSELFEDIKDLEKKVYELNSGSRKARLQSAISVSETVVPVVKNKVTEVYQWGGGRALPQKQELFVKGRSVFQVTAGHSHFAAVTVEKELYTWANVQDGSSIVGQLGHGDTAAYKTPKKVEALEGIGVIRVECGEDFTICLTDEGQLYSFGSDYYGCLGCDNQEGDEVLTPILINFFSDKFVQEMACGDNHVVALTKDGEVYTWGCGEFGRLGQGSEDDFALPQKVNAPKKHIIKHVFAGSDGTFLTTTTGRLLACGSNENNKLGFNSETSGLKKRKPQVYDIPCKYTFSLVRPLMRYHIIFVAPGKTHTAVIDLYGHLYTFGSNKYGQLGVGDFRKKASINYVQRFLSGYRVERVACGDGFTVVATNDNQVYSWGNGENGRLGLDFADQGKGPNSQSTANPRPIFGSLHIVPALSARHWHTILIAEKVVNQKTLKSRISCPKYLASPPNFRAAVNLSSVHESPPVTPEDSAFSDDIIGIGTPNSCLGAQMTLDSGKPLSPDISGLNEQAGRTTDQAANSLPPWLQMELEEAEYIPLPENYHQHGGQSQGYEYGNQEEAHGGQSQGYAYGNQEEEHAANFSNVDIKNSSKSNINSHHSADISNFGQAHENNFQNKSDKDRRIEELEARVRELELENERLRKELLRINTE